MSVPLHDLEDIIDRLHRFHQQGWLRDDEHGILHVVRELGNFAIHVFQERKDFRLHVRQHVVGGHAFEFAPSKSSFVDGKLLRIFLCAILGRDPFTFKAGRVSCFRPAVRGIGLLLLVEVVQPFHEQEVGDLFDRRERIGDPATPEFVPELADLVLEFSIVLKHVGGCYSNQRKTANVQDARAAVSESISFISVSPKMPRIP